MRLPWEDLIEDAVPLASPRPWRAPRVRPLRRSDFPSSKRFRGDLRLASCFRHPRWPRVKIVSARQSSSGVLGLLAGIFSHPHPHPSRVDKLGNLVGKQSKRPPCFYSIPGCWDASRKFILADMRYYRNSESDRGSSVGWSRDCSASYHHNTQGNSGR